MTAPVVDVQIEQAPVAGIGRDVVGEACDLGAHA